MDMDSGAVMQSKDACFKLFGRTIPLPEIQIQGMSQSQPLDTEECGEIMKAEGEYSHEEESEDSTKVSEENHGNDPTPVLTSEARDPKLKEDQVESGTMSDEKSVKKPEKILPCPRCNSSETKFCYFNNYNVHQPRHFCKNCQRYWTAGGTMRNVPVGAGRRKNKHLTTQYRQMMVSSQLMPNNRMEAADSGGHRPPVEKGTVLKFSPDATLCDSVETVLNLKGQSGHTDVSNSREHMEELSPSGSSITASSFQEPALSHEILQRNQCGLSRPFDNLLSQQPLNCYPVPPWSLPWNSGWNGVPLQLIPASYLGCVPMPIWPADQGFVRGANGCSTSSFSPTNGSASNSSPTLGKHSRDTNSTSYDVSGPCVIVPKLMRIDEPNEGSNSPILTTLGICPGKKCPQPNARAGENASESDANQFLEANPAALSRSHIFQEST